MIVVIVVVVVIIVIVVIVVIVTLKSKDDSLSDSLTRSPIELSWNAKKVMAPQPCGHVLLQESPLVVSKASCHLQTMLKEYT